MILKLFILKEIKKFPLFFLLLIVTLLLGTFGLISISVVSEQVRQRLQHNARELLTSDIVVSARRPLLEGELKNLNQVTSSLKHESYRLIDIYSMITHLKTSQTRLVEIRGFEEGFPFYGEIKVDRGSFGADGLYLSMDLAELWKINVSDELKIGEKIFKVKAIVLSDSSQGLRGFSFAPRIYLPLFELEKTELLKPGATGSFAHHYKINDYKNDDFVQLRKKLLTALPDSAIRVMLPEQSSEQSGRAISYLTDFMSLAALIGLLLSLVGVFYLYQSHLIARLKDYCLFHLYGISPLKIIGGVLTQISLVFILVLLLEGLLLAPIYHVLRPALSSLLGIDLAHGVNLKFLLTHLPFLYALSISILTPLLLGLLRTPMGQQLKASKISMGKFRFYDFIPFMIILWIFASFLAHSFKLGSFFVFALLFVFVLSTTLIKLAQWILQKLSSPQNLAFISLETGMALRNIVHSGHKLTLSFLCLALSTTLISLVLQLDHLIQREFTLDEKKPSLFIFDIQEEQLLPFEKFASNLGLKLEGVTPMIRARLEKVNGKVFERAQEETSDFQSREDEFEARMKNRGINLTYREALSPAETIVEGEDFGPGDLSQNMPAPVSLEKRFAQRMGLKIGDLITFDIQGVEMSGAVKNFREVKWTSFYPNFFVNIGPGHLEDAPKTYLAVLPQGPKNLKKEFQKQAVAQFPNISFIDMEELIQKLSTLFNKSRQAIEVISWLSLGIGLIILYGLCHDQVYRRYYDLALLKVLGLSGRNLLYYLLIEFGFVFLFAMGIGLFMGWAMAMLIGQEVFKVSWSVAWAKIFYPSLLLSILCLVTIFLSSWRAIRTRPRVLLNDA